MVCLFCKSLFVFVVLLLSYRSVRSFFLCAWFFVSVFLSYISSFVTDVFLSQGLGASFRVEGLPCRGSALSFLMPVAFFFLSYIFLSRVESCCSFFLVLFTVGLVLYKVFFV